MILTRFSISTPVSMAPVAALLAAALVSLAPAGTAQADGVYLVDPYARTSGTMATSGAAFMVIENRAAEDDRLVSVASDVAERVELHTHREDANGVMQMIEVEEGFVIPAGGSHALQRGGDHIMFLGLTRPLAHGDAISVTLTFEREGEVAVIIPVDLERRPEHGVMEGHGHHQTHGN